MSLINDALKRANESTPPPPRPPGEATPPLRAVEYKTPATWPLLVLPLALFLVFGFAGWFLWHGWQAQREEAPNPDKAPVVARENSPPTPPSAAPVEPVAVAVPPPVEPAPPAVPIETPAVEPVKSDFPSLKLQGIFFRASNPAVMINSKTLYVGDKVQGAKIVSITQDTVTVEFGGQTGELTLH